MSKEQYEEITTGLNEIMRKIEALPESTANGLLIDAASHAKSASEHLCRYVQLKGVTK